jgi:hypothetical protein
MEQKQRGIIEIISSKEKKLYIQTNIERYDSGEINMRTGQMQQSLQKSTQI